MTTNNNPISLLRIVTVQSRTGLARSTIYKLIDEGDFPPPVKITAKAVAWPSNAIDHWIESRIAESISVH